MSSSAPPAPIGRTLARGVATAATFGAFLGIGAAGGEGFAPSTLLEFLGWFLVPGVCGVVAGARRDSTMAKLTYLSGIAGATAVAWAAGPVGVLPGADPAMRSSYYAMLVAIAAAVSAVLGSLVVGGGYWLGRRLPTRQRRR